MLLIVGAAFLGLSATIRDLVAEREIFEHERDAGLSPIGYLAAKLHVFSCGRGGQSTILVGLCSRSGGGRRSLVLASGGLDYCRDCCDGPPGVAVGLAVSSRVATTEQSMPPWCCWSWPGW